MHARDQLERRTGGHAVVDDRFVQSLEGVARNRGHVFDAEAAHDIDHEVAAAARLGRAVRAGRTLLALARYDLYGVALGCIRRGGPFCSVRRSIGGNDRLSYRARTGES